MPSKSNPIISSHRDAATRVSKYLSENHGVNLKPIAALEIVARALGANNWQTLKAMADQGRAPRIGEGVWFSGNPVMLPEIGAGPVLANFFVHDGSAGQTSSVALERQVRDHLQAPRPLAKEPGKTDQRVDPSDVQSISSMLTRDNLWNALVHRVTEYKAPTLPDLDSLLDWVQHEMTVVLSPTQRAAVKHALYSPLSVVSGYPDSGKSVIAEAIVRTAHLAGLNNIVNARRGDVGQVDGVNFKVPEYRRKDEHGAFSSFSDEHLGPYLAASDLLIVDQHVTGDKDLFWRVVLAAPATCRIAILGEIPMNDGSELSQMLKDLVAGNFAKYTQLHEILRQPHPHGTELSNREPELRGASHVPDYEVRGVTVVSNPRESGRQVENPSPDAATKPEPRAINGARYSAKFIPAVRPSEAWHVNGYLFAPNARNFVSTDLTGKWCVPCDKDTVDELWEKVLQEIRTSRLFTALVSSPNNARAHGGSYIICVFTPDWADEDEVMRARQVLRELGVTQEIGYKRDIETANGVYGTPAEWYYRV